MAGRRWLSVLAAVLAAVAAPREVFAAPKVSQPGPRMIKIPGRTFTMGGDNESGAYKSADITLQTYSLHETAVTNKDFRAFVKDTKYKTEAETFGWSFVLNSSLSKATRADSDQHIKDAPHWIAVANSYWRFPEGRDSSLADRWDHPAVHVSWNDAKKYCEWAGLRLPTEAEWENAARGTDMASMYPHGDGEEPMGPEGEWMMNIWQGTFPAGNTAQDGYAHIAPVKAFSSNSYGLYTMVGNVWEWTSCKMPTQNQQDRQATLKGGSFLDSLDGSVNHKATVVTRMGNTLDSGSYNTGFRCAKGVGGGGRPLPPDPEELEKLLAEGGVDAVNEAMAKMGQNTKLMKATDLEKVRKQNKKQMAALRQQMGADAEGKKKEGGKETKGAKGGEL